MTTLFDVLKKTYVDLGHMEISTATGGSTSTLIDTKLGEKYGDGDTVGSTIFIIRDAGGLGAAPEAEVSYITDYVSSTNTFSVSPSYSAAVGAGDRFGIAKNIIDIETMKEITNDALQAFGTIQLTDTSITTVTEQTEYSLPVLLKHRIDSVQISTNSTTGNREFNDIGGWYQINSAAGSVGMLVFNESLPAGETLKIFYSAEHPKLNAMTDVIAEVISSELACKLIVDRAYQYQIRRTNGTDPFLLQTSNKAMQDVMEARNRFSQPKHKRPKYLTPYNFRDTDFEDDD
jgi:hypothetical protein